MADTVYTSDQGASSSSSVNATTNMFLGIVEGDRCIFLKAGEAMVEMDVVKLDASNEGKVTKCTDNEEPFGFCMQEVTTAGVKQNELNGLITRTEKVGNIIGIAFNGGIYNCKPLSAVTRGARLYASGGKLTATKPHADAIAVGIAMQSKDALALTRFKSLL